MGPRSDDPQAPQFVNFPLHCLESAVGIEHLQPFRAQEGQHNIAEPIVELGQVGRIIAVSRSEPERAGRAKSVIPLPPESSW